MKFDVGPQKNEYKFKEVASITGVKPYVLRFWESEFSEISPRLTGDGIKIYSSSDLENIKKIRDMLFDEKLSIPKAKAMLAESLEMELPKEQDDDSGVEVREAIGNLIFEKSNHLNDLKSSLQGDIESHKQKLSQKQFNDQDVLSLVKAKKKLNSVLSKIDTIISAKNWN